MQSIWRHLNLQIVSSVKVKNCLNTLSGFSPARVVEAYTENCKPFIDTISKNKADRMGQVETSEWLKMLRRMIRAAGRRVANADEHELADLVSLRDQLDQSIKHAIQGQRSAGRSWAHIGQALGLSRQGAFQRYGDLDNEK